MSSVLKLRCVCCLVQGRLLPSIYNSSGRAAVLMGGGGDSHAITCTCSRSGFVSS